MKNIRHSLFIGLITFFISVIINLSSSAILAVSPVTVSFILLFFIVLLGIVFDIIGTAAAAGTEAPFHAMASDRIAGAKQSIWLVRNADKVATFSNDVVGDIAGTISGAIGASIIFHFTLGGPRINADVINTFLIGFIAAVTVAGKAIGKRAAISRSTEILYLAGRVLYNIEKLGIDITGNTKDKRKFNNEKKRN